MVHHRVTEGGQAVDEVGSRIFEDAAQFVQPARLSRRRVRLLIEEAGSHVAGSADLCASAVQGVDCVPPPRRAGVNEWADRMLRWRLGGSLLVCLRGLLSLSLGFVPEPDGLGRLPLRPFQDMRVRVEGARRGRERVGGQVPLASGPAVSECEIRADCPRRPAICAYGQVTGAWRDQMRSATARTPRPHPRGGTARRGWETARSRMPGLHPWRWLEFGQRKVA